jgi:hypothetical protein
MLNAHLSDEQVVDLLEGTAGWELRRHADACGPCAVRVKDAGEGWAFAASDVALPEPSPLYWDAFRQNTQRQLASQPSPLWRRPWFAPLTAAAAVLAGIISVVPLVTSPPPPSEVPGMPALPAWSALPPADDDDGLRVLAALPSEDLEDAAVCQGVNDCVLSLSDDESHALATTLRQELGHGRQL